LNKVLKAGFAEAVITPPIGVHLGGFAARLKPSVGIHDELKARALALEMGPESVVMVSCDLLALTFETVKAIREMVEAQTSLSRDKILVAATHTHSGPDMAIPFREEVSRSWIENLQLQIAGCAVSAHNSREESVVASGLGDAYIGFNRRRKGGPVDPQLCLLRVDKASMQPLAVAMNYTCHAVVLGAENLYISADYPGFAVRSLEKFMEVRGKSLKAAFFNGACGDINPVTSEGYACPGTFQDADRLGTILAAEALKVYEELKPKKPERFKLSALTVDLPVRQPPPLESAEGRLKIAQSRASGPLDVELIYAREEYLLALQELKGSVKAEVQALAIDDMAMVALPGEALVNLGLAVKRGSPFAKTAVVGYGNGYFGYIASEEDFRQGGYETRLARWSFLKPEAYQILSDTAVKLLKDLHPEIA